MGNQNLTGHGAEGFAQEPWVAPDYDASAGGLLRNYVTRDTRNRASNVREGELFRHDRAPAGCSKMYLRRHVPSPLPESGDNLRVVTAIKGASAR